MESKFIELEHSKLHYLQAGEGKPIVFLHGFPEFSLMWKKQFEFFIKNYKVIVPEQEPLNLENNLILIIYKCLILRVI